jgi:hypothetical protein
MKTNKRTIAKYIRLYAIGLWGVVSFIYIAGEPMDDNMAIGEFFLFKMLGIASLGLCALVWKRLDKAGKLPDMEDEEDCEI